MIKPKEKKKFITDSVISLLLVERNTNDPLKPQRGEKYIGPETGTIYEWDGEKWVVIGSKAALVGAEDA